MFFILMIWLAIMIIKRAGGGNVGKIGIFSNVSPVVKWHFIAVVAAVIVSFFLGAQKYGIVLAPMFIAIYASLAFIGIGIMSIVYLNEHKKDKLEKYKKKGGFMARAIDGITDWEKVTAILNKTDVMKTVDWEHLRAYVKDNVIGQGQVIDAIIEQTKFRWNRLKKSQPIGVYFCGGESGTGKTHLTKVLSKGIFGEGMNFLRLDMGEFHDSHTAIYRLIGAPPQFQGGEGQLTGFLSRYPNSIVLLDEVEKADPKIWDNFLALFDEGRITDQHTQRVCDGTKAIFILTSNLEKEKLMQAMATVNEMKTADEETKQEELNGRIKTILGGATDPSRGGKFFRPELLNRIDAFFVFTALKPIEQAKIAALELKNYAKSAEDIELENIAPELIVDVVQRNMSAGETGAREIKKIVEKLIRRQTRNARMDGVTHARLDVENDNFVLVPSAIREGIDPVVLGRKYN
jgi:ATP-dependent Clp protease ATP-binding subunit ClpA